MFLASVVAGAAMCEYSARQPHDQLRHRFGQHVAKAVIACEEHLATP
jgi:hypothetical protein